MKLRMLVLGCVALVAGIGLFLLSRPAPTQRGMVDAMSLSVDQVVAGFDTYRGREITVHGVVERISAERGMFTLIDVSEVDCTDACDKAIVVVRIPEKGAMPQAGMALQVTGRFDEQAGSPVLELREMAAIRKS